MVERLMPKDTNKSLLKVTFSQYKRHIKANNAKIKSLTQQMTLLIDDNKLLIKEAQRISQQLDSERELS